MIEVTTPKLPLPPRSAQNRSGSRPASTVRTMPSAVTTVISRTWSAAKPKVLAIGPTPPPRVKPTTPTEVAEPQSGARSYAAAAATTSVQVQPAPIRAVQAKGSTSSSRILDVVISSAPSAAWTAPWPVAWTATGSPRSAANRTAAATSSSQVAATMRAGWCRTARLKAEASSSKPFSPGNSTGPEIWLRSPDRSMPRWSADGRAVLMIFS